MSRSPTTTAASIAVVHLPCGCERCIEALAAAPKVGLVLSELPTSSPDAVRRFLRGCKGDPAKAAHVLTTSYLWRHEFGADQLREDPDGSAAERTEVLGRIYPSTLYDRRDREGRVLWIERTGLCDPAVAWASAVFRGEDGPTAWLRNHVRLNELAGQVHPQRVVIMDMHNAGKGHLCKAGMELIKRMIQIDQRNYPESLHRLFIVNTPWLLHASYAVIARWMDPVTASKIQVLGSVAEPEVQTSRVPGCRPHAPQAATPCAQAATPCAQAAHQSAQAARLCAQAAAPCA